MPKKIFGGFIYDEAKMCPRCHYTTISYGLSGKCSMCPHSEVKPNTVCLEPVRGVMRRVVAGAVVEAADQPQRAG